MYNEHIKNRFLNEYDNEGTQNTIKAIFIKTSGTEETLEKDLFNFSINDIKNVYKNLDPKAASTSHSYGRFIRTYISWSIKHGYRDDNLNPLNGVESQWFNQFVDRSKKIHYSFEELMELVEEFPNAQEQALVWLLFEGVQGRDFSEIKKLRYYDINWETNELTLTDYDKSKRTHIVSNQCMRYIENAYKSEIHFGSNSEKGRKLVRSDFILRPVTAPRVKTEDISSPALYNRLNTLKNIFGLEYLTANAIKQSGMIHMAYELFNRDGQLKYSQFAEIGERYNSPKFFNNGVEMFNTTLMKDFINSQKLKELYDIDVAL